jgi:hypothetical protein
MRIIRAIIVALVLIMLVPAGSTMAYASTSYRADAAQYRGSTTELGFRINGNKHLARISDVSAAIDMPRRYTNNFCAYAVLRVNGRNRAVNYRDCDTNGDARLAWRFPDIYVHPGDVVSVWFSDAVSRYRVTHPSIRVR